MMNQELSAAALASDVLDSVFEMWWPKLEEKVTKIVSSDRKLPKQAVRSERDILEEILARLRAAPLGSSSEAIHPGAIRDLVEGYDRLMFEVARLSPEARESLGEVVERLRMPLEYIARRTRVDDDVASLARRERLEVLRRRAIADEVADEEATEVVAPKPKPNKRVHRTR
jgi:hypothetical protein